MKIYICGTISGGPQYRKKYDEAAAFLRSLGHVVVNPAKKPEGLSFRECVDLGLRELSMCDAIFVPEGTKAYDDVALETRYGFALKIKIYSDSNDTRKQLKEQAKKCERIDKEESKPDGKARKVRITAQMMRKREAQK